MLSGTLVFPNHENSHLDIGSMSSQNFCRCQALRRCLSGFQYRQVASVAAAITRGGSHLAAAAAAAAAAETLCSISTHADAAESIFGVCQASRLLCQADAGQRRVVDQGVAPVDPGGISLSREQAECGGLCCARRHDCLRAQSRKFA